MARGNFRLDPENCNFPPLLLNFKKGDLANTVFDGQDKLKLVTPCQQESDVIEEYLIYKMYNIVSDISLKVRLVKIIYYDTGSEKKLFEKFSFFIEEEDHLEKDLNAFKKNIYMTPFDVDRDNYGKMTVFQYLVGNKDWYITTRHNILVLQPEDNTKLPYAVPYDFDFSGLVDANYTKPAGVPDYKLEERRVYKGICYTEEEFGDIFDFYREIRPELESVIQGQELISRSSRNRLGKYIDQFYEAINDEELIIQEFLSVCQTKKDYNIVEDFVNVD